MIRIAVILPHYTTLEVLELGKNNLQSVGAIEIACALFDVNSVTSAGSSNNNISKEAADDFAVALSHNANLQELYLSNKNLKLASAINIGKSLQNTVKLILRNNYINEEAADDIAAVLSHIANLQELYLNGKTMLN